MLELPQVTLISLTGRNFEAHQVATEYSCRDIKFGAVKVIYDFKIKTIDDWNRKIIFDLWKYVDTKFAMLIHPDGFIRNSDLWNWDWLFYDYIGAPWPMPNDSYSYRDEQGNIIRVGNSVSLRSKKIMLYPTLYEFEWKEYFGNTNEDGFLTCHNRRLFQHFGARYAPIEVAKWFSRELDIPENADVESPFAFHLHDTMAGRNEKYKSLMI